MEVHMRVAKCTLKYQLLLLLIKKCVFWNRGQYPIGSYIDEYPPRDSNIKFCPKSKLWITWRVTA